MKRCDCCNKPITTLKYYESNNANYCLKCGDANLVEEIELQVSRNKVYINQNEKSDVYNDDEIQDIEKFCLVEHQDDDLEELIEYLNDELRSKDNYIFGLREAA